MGNKDNPRVVYNTASLSEKDFCFLKKINIKLWPKWLCRTSFPNGYKNDGQRQDDGDGQTGRAGCQFVIQFGHCLSFFLSFFRLYSNCFFFSFSSFFSMQSAKDFFLFFFCFNWWRTGSQSYESGSHYNSIGGRFMRLAWWRDNVHPSWESSLAPLCCFVPCHARGPVTSPIGTGPEPHGHAIIRIKKKKKKRLTSWGFWTVTSSSMTLDGLVPVSSVSKRTTKISTSVPLGDKPETATVTWMLLEALAMETAAVPPQPGQLLLAPAGGVSTALKSSVDRAL